MTVDDAAAETLQRISRVRDEALNDVGSRESAEALADLRRDVLGKSGSLLLMRRALGTLPQEQRKVVGAALNAAIQEVTARIEARDQELLNAETALEHLIDVSLPGLPPVAGGLHPTMQLMYDLNDAFAALNFGVYEGPEISSELFEFDYMNFPPEHPARESM
ncbi:MAG: hypothetical protein ACRDRW_16305, partial [Pseudonocardiaceae bacterium]